MVEDVEGLGHRGEVGQGVDNFTAWRRNENLAFSKMGRLVTSRENVSLQLQNKEVEGSVTGLEEDAWNFPAKVVLCDMFFGLIDSSALFSSSSRRAQTSSLDANQGLLPLEFVHKVVI